MTSRILIAAALVAGCGGGESALAPCESDLFAPAQCEPECVDFNLDDFDDISCDAEGDVICAQSFEAGGGRRGCCDRDSDEQAVVRFFECEEG